MVPSVPDVPAAQRSTASYALRWEDLTQDGRIRLPALVASIGPTIWKKMLAHEPTQAALAADGVRSVFTRLVLDAGSARFSLGERLATEGAYQLAHERGPDGAVVRLYLNTWTSIRAASGRAPRLFAEHVMTRLLSPPERRRVTALPDGKVPEAIYRATPFDALLSLPDGSDWLEPGILPDPSNVVFGLVHTDVNQHVNSMVYGAIFEEAVLRRLAALGRSTKVLGRTLEVGFRKPFFAGDTARVALRLFDDGPVSGAVGTFAELGDPAGAKPNVYLRMRFEP
jgi:hypothetical protein